MTQLIDLGKVRFSWAGDWSNTAQYETNDVVKYGGNVYVYTYAVKTSGNLPTDTTYWALMIQGFKFRGVYDAGTLYRVGDGIAYGGKVYICVLDGTGFTPPNATYWSQFADGIQYEGAYSGTAGYQRNDIVTYGGSVYIAKQDTTNNLPTVTAYWDKFVDGISPQGVYNNGTAYVPGQVVAYGANLYRCILQTTGNIPTNTTYWTLYTASVRSVGNWATATTYYLNDIVSYGGNTFICVVQHASGTFATDLASNNWQKFNGGIRWRGNWTASTAYLTGDVVKSTLGSAYVANQDFTSSSAFNTDFSANKWDLFVVGGSDVIPTINANGADVGKQLTVKPDGTYAWIGGTGNILWVGPNGTDAATAGKNMNTPFASLKYACSVATAGTTIRVTAGTYSEQLPITVPAGVAIVGDNQRTTIIQPKSGNSDDGTTPNNQSTMFLMSNGSILNKMTFIGMTGWVPGSTAADITTSTPKGVVARLNPASTVTTKSPYVLECAAILSGGIGALVDGSVHASGNKSMLFHEFTVISDNGVGFWMKDGGKCEIVSCFTYYCYFGYAATGGSQIRSLSGNNSYGTYGAVSSGFDASETAMTGSLVGRELVYSGLSGTVNVGDTVTSSAGGTATVLNVQVSANKVYVNNITGTFAATNTLTFTSGGTATVATDALRDQRGFVLMVTGLSALPKAGVSISLAGDSQAYVVQTVSGTWTNTSSILALVLTTEKVTGSASGTTATFRYNFSKVRLTGHDFLSIGTGGVTTTNYPGTPTQAAAQGNEITETFPGRVFYVSTDQDGNLRVGKYFRVDQATGKATLNASAFDLSGLSSLRLGSIGAQVGELIGEFSSDATMSANSNSKVPTEYAVRTFVNNKLQTDVNLATGGNTQAPTVTAVKTYVDGKAVTNAILGDSYSFNLNTSATFQDQTFRAFFGSGGGTFTWSLTGTPPSGMTISQTGVLSNGSQTISAGTYNFNIQVVSGGVTVTRAITIMANAGVPLFSTQAMPVTLTPSTAYTINAATATVGSGTITYAVASGSLPTTMSLNTSTGVLSGTAGASSSTPIPYAFTISATANGYTATKSFSGTLYFYLIQGQSLFGTNVGPGTYSWTAPAGVTSVSAVCVGAGGWGGYSWSSGGSGGGGLGWKNNIAVTPGQSYTVQVGSYGTQPSNSATSSNGTPSFFINTSTVAGYAGGTGGPNASGSGSAYGGGYAGDGGGVGGTGGSGSWTGGGGGAGGYSGNGGNYNAGGSGGGGGGASSYYSSTWGTGGGGGVGLNGQGASGSTNGYNPWSPGYSGSGGQGGSGGADGGYGELPWSYGNCRGGDYGGGGGGSGTSTGQNYPNTYQQRGGAAGVRIIWGSGRSFPSTNTADVTVQSI